jgi:antitoxin YefM
LQRSKTPRKVKGRKLSATPIDFMQTISEPEAKKEFSALLDNLARLREPFTITRDGAGAAVLLSAEEYASMQETLYLLSSPANVERLHQALEDLKAGKAESRKLCD